MYQKKSGAETAGGCNAALIFIHLVLEKRCSFVNHEKKPVTVKSFIIREVR